MSFLAMCPPKSDLPTYYVHHGVLPLLPQPPSFLFLTQLCLLDKSSFMFNLMNQELCLLINRSCHIHPWGNFSLFPLAFQPGYSFSWLPAFWFSFPGSNPLAPLPPPDITEKGYAWSYLVFDAQPGQQEGKRILRWRYQLVLSSVKSREC